MWSGCELNAFEYSSQGGSEIYTPDVISGSDTVKNLQISFKKKKKKSHLFADHGIINAHIFLSD